MNVDDLSGRVAVVTGAASGIGRETALALARRGADLAICDVDEPGLEQTAQQILAEIERLDAIARAFARFGAPPTDGGPLMTVDIAAVARDAAALCVALGPLAAGASPRLLLADLQGQLDQPAVVQHADRILLHAGDRAGPQGFGRMDRDRRAHPTGGGLDHPQQQPQQLQIKLTCSRTFSPNCTRLCS